jgi:hypothetical protein
MLLSHPAALGPKHSSSCTYVPPQISSIQTLIYQYSRIQEFKGCLQSTSLNETAQTFEFLPAAPKIQKFTAA